MAQFNDVYDAMRNPDTADPRIVRDIQNNGSLSSIATSLSRIDTSLDSINLRQGIIFAAVGCLSISVSLASIYRSHTDDNKRAAHAPAIAAADTNRDGVTSMDEVVGMYKDIGLRVVEERPGVYTFNGKPIIENGILRIDQPKLDSYVASHQVKQ